MKSTVGIAAIAFMILALDGPALGQNGWTDDGTVVRLTTSTDKVGIGTDGPGDVLDITNSASAHAGIVINKTDAFNYDPHIQLKDAGHTWTIKVDRSESDKLKFDNDAGNALTIDNAGKVGFGTASPGDVLDITNSASAHAGIVINKTDAYDYDPHIQLKDAGHTWTIKVDRNDSDKLKFENNAGIAATIDTDGNVGIGTDSPGYKLDVDGTIRIRTGWRGLKIEGSGSDPHRYDFIVGDLGGSPSNSGSFSIYDHTASAYRFAISKTGNVGIGTMNAGSYKLAVNGKIRAKEVVVETGWSDFVFEEGYVLKPLDEVETYIKSNKHLPGVPSQQEVQANGVGLGAMQAKLLEKVEELTLYVIDLKKENEALKTRIAEVEK